VENSRRVVESIIAEDRTVYGVNTGFGKLSDIRIEPSQLRDLQLNLVRSHACGLGAPLSIVEARAMVLLRANVLALGYSGCRPVLIETLVAMLERGVTPVIPGGPSAPAATRSRPTGP
jgi:histidine ammonia-lyase